MIDWINQHRMTLVFMLAMIAVMMMIVDAQVGNTTISNVLGALVWIVIVMEWVLVISGILRGQ